MKKKKKERKEKRRGTRSRLIESLFIFPWVFWLHFQLDHASNDSKRKGEGFRAGRDRKIFRGSPGKIKTRFNPKLIQCAGSN